MPDDVTPKRPASQYYWGDWFKDLALQSCSLPARGLWHEMNCLMHQGDPYGYLTLNGRPMTLQQLANQCRITPAVCKKLVEELLAAGVPSIAQDTGAMFSRRMVRDEKLREQRAEIGRANGAKGAEFGARGAEHGRKGGRPAKLSGGSGGGREPGEEPGQNPPKEPPQNPRPSSSSSSSSSPPSVGEDSPDGLVGKTDLPPCPVEQIVAVYHEVLPELPRAKMLDDGRRKAVRGLWKFALTQPKSDGKPRATTADEAFTWVRSFFERARDNDFLMGRTPRVNGHQGWECDLDFLLSKKGLKQVIEKTREQRH